MENVYTLNLIITKKPIWASDGDEEEDVEVLAVFAGDLTPENI